MNVIVRLEFKLINFEAAVKHFWHYITGDSPQEEQGCKTEVQRGVTWVLFQRDRYKYTEIDRVIDRYEYTGYIMNKYDR